MAGTKTLGDALDSLLKSETVSVTPKTPQAQEGEPNYTLLAVAGAAIILLLVVIAKPQGNAVGNQGFPINQNPQAYQEWGIQDPETYQM